MAITAKIQRDLGSEWALITLDCYLSNGQVEFDVTECIGQSSGEPVFPPSIILTEAEYEEIYTDLFNEACDTA